MNQNSKARQRWLKRRAQGIGASEAAAAIGESPWSSRYDLWARKRGLTSEIEQTEAMEWGIRLESAIVKKFIEETKRTIVNDGKYKVWQHPDHEWMLCTLDRRQTSLTLAEANSKQAWGVLEIKFVSEYRREEWAEAAPRYVWIQVQHQLAVTGYAWGSVAGLIGGWSFRWQDIERDDDFIRDTLIPKEWELWQHVIKNREPPVDGSEWTAKALSAAHPKGDGKAVALPPAAVMWDMHRERICEQIKELEGQKATLTNRLKQAIGDGSAGVLPDGIRYTLSDASDGRQRALRRSRVKT